MSGYVDVHCHILPGIDDGPDDLDGALAMARAAADSGFGTVVATPHLRSDFPHVHVEELAERVADLRGAIADAGIRLKLVAGAEVSLVWALEASPEGLALATFAQGGSDLLIETPLDATTGIQDLLFTLRAREFRITLAHPERSRGFQDDPAALRELVRQGVQLQVNASALLAGARRSPVGKLARWLCVEGLAHVIASDAHRAESWRPITALPEGRSAVAALVGEDRARWMTEGVPAAIIEGCGLPPAPAIVKAGRFGRGRRLRTNSAASVRASPRP